MNVYVRSMIGGFVATVVLSILMVMKSKMGLMPDLDVIKMLSGMAHSRMGIDAGPAFGWVMHFMIGTVLWGVLFALLYGRLPGGDPIGKGIVFGLGAWLLMMLLPMPMAGAGLFGMKMGMMAPVMTLVLHVIWGAVLGWVFGALGPKTSVPA
ncbi:MAG: hypothetical protein KGJ55_11535 [Gammaproteobacteria bacterium]|nr:hypothetical protein [Gammaproteobacteria bacterium]